MTILQALYNAVALVKEALPKGIGGFMILADRPFNVGQRIKVKDHYGIVERLGMRSTQIRLLNGPLVKIPNEEMARVEIEDVTLRQNLRRSANITIEYNTPPEKVEKAVDIIKDILKDREGMDIKRPARVYFNDFNPDSLNISMMYWYHPAKIWKSKTFGEKVNLQILREFEKEGIKFAYPTTTTYLAQEGEQSLHFIPPLQFVYPISGKDYEEQIAGGQTVFRATTGHIALYGAYLPFEGKLHDSAHSLSDGIVS